MKHAIKFLLAFIFVGLSFTVFGSNLSDSIVDTNETPTRVMVSPNPATDNFTILVPGGSFDFVMFSTNGKQILSAADCLDSYNVDASSLDAGVYILNIIVDDNIFMKRVILSK